MNQEEKNIELVKKAKEHLKDRGFGTGTNYNTSTIIELMISFLEENGSRKMRKLKAVIVDLKNEKEQLLQEALFCEKKNFNIEGQILNEKATMINITIMAIELGVIKEVL